MAKFTLNPLTGLFDITGSGGASGGPLEGHAILDELRVSSDAEARITDTTSVKIWAIGGSHRLNLASLSFVEFS